jgi:hypothetical protein
MGTVFKDIGNSLLNETITTLIKSLMELKYRDSNYTVNKQILFKINLKYMLWENQRILLN